ncbi:MAG: nuclear transport factor 2 family protein [Planctomycetia bacterium]|nr:nuclear transport factor 2 family protein [Planctomycetia bacterium]
MLAGSTGRGWIARGIFWLAALGASATGAVVAADVAAEPKTTAELKAASAAYAAAYNKSDYAALADQWTERATLVEGRLELEGREAIVNSLRAWRERNPEATMEIAVRDVDLLAEPVARVVGTLTFRSKPGAKPVSSRFTSLRVREGATWRLAESIVVAEHAAALDDLDWLVGTWTTMGTKGEKTGPTAIETVYEKMLGGYCLLGRSRIQVAEGPAVEALEIIHADRATGVIRSWVYDSTGAQGEGVITVDDGTVEKTMVGTPSDRVPGAVARWTQVVAPTGEGRVTMHSIERSIDGVAMPDGQPLHFRKVR